MPERITRKLIEIAHAAIERERIIFDTEVRGFGIRLRPGVEPSYFFRYSTGAGAKAKVPIGLASDLKPEEAREAARALRRAVLGGEDPRSARMQARAIPTLRELRDRYLSEWAAVEKKPSSQRSDAQLWDRNLTPILGSIRVDRITEADLLRLKAKMKDRPGAANRTLALLSKALQLCEVWGYRPKRSNPCYGFKRFDEEPREMILSPEQLAQLDEVLEIEAPARPWIAHLVRLLLFTGARLSEITRARITDVDFARKVLVLPDSKTGRGEIQLPELALEEIRSIERPAGCPWLIPGERPGRPICSPYASWGRIRTAAGIPACRLHDLRHCFGSYSHRAGASQRTIAKLLRHRVLATTERYIQGFDKDRQEAADRTAEALQAMLKAR